MFDMSSTSGYLGATSEVGGLSSTGKSLRVVHVRAACMSSEIGVNIYRRLLSLFPFRLGRFSLFPSPPPPISYPASAGFIGIFVFFYQSGVSATGFLLDTNTTGGMFPEGGKAPVP